MKKKLVAIMLAMMLPVMTVHAETPEQIAEEVYWDSLELMAACIEAEAGNQDLYGKRLVADVILNRVDSNEFPDSIYEVITQKRQFTTWGNGMIDRLQDISQESYTAVIMEMENRTDSDILFFTARKFGRYGTPAYKYGDHYFSK